MNGSKELEKADLTYYKNRTHMLSSILQTSKDAIILIHPEGNILEYNPAFTHLFDIEDESSIAEQSIVSFLVDEDKSKMQKDIDYALMNDALANCEYRIGTETEGIYTYIEVSYNKIYIQESHQSFIAIFIRDITKRKIDENALQKAKEKAEQADRLKTAFLANMSHEIRTPINAILGFADLLKDDDLEEGEQEEFINIINTNGKNLLNLINDIIDIAKIEANQLKIIEQEVNLFDLFTEVRESLLDVMKHLEKEAISLEFHLPEALAKQKIYSDYFRLRQVIVNLVGNAIKFTDEGSISYGVSVDEENLVFYVKDTGMGIEESDLGIIFDRFRQSDGIRIEGGTGLGLTISQNILKLMKGKIWVESKIHEGSTFSFSIPYRYVDGNEIIDIQKVLKDEKAFLEGKNVLIVEDTETNFHLLDIIIKREKANTIWATNGVQAVDICKHNKEIDVVLMDINLPIMDGYEATRLIKEENPDLPIIAQTAYAMAGERARSRNFGCDAYVAKPINPQHLLSVIKEVL